MVDSETKFILKILLSKSIGPRSFDKLLKVHKRARDIWAADSSSIAKHIGPHRARIFASFRKSFTSDSTHQYLLNNFIHIINPRSSKWANHFQHIFDKPLLLFAKGNVNLIKNSNNLSVAVIGSRKPSAYAICQTESMCKTLALNGITIISGMALGIDSIAHNAALDNGGKTIAVLGSPLDKPYPSRNSKLYKDIVSSGGLVLSEFPPGTPTYPGNFVQRNRLVSGLSKAIFIIEGTKKSGTLTTLKYASEQGIDIYALPNRVDSPLSYAPHHAIQEGGKLIHSPNDLLSEFGITHTTHTRDSHTPSKLNHTHTAFTKTQNAILAVLKEPKFALEISRDTKLPPPTTLVALSELEIASCVKRGPDGRYYATIINENLYEST